MSPTSYQTAPSRTEDLALYALELHYANFFSKKLIFAHQVLRIETNTAKTHFLKYRLDLLNPQQNIDYLHIHIETFCYFKHLQKKYAVKS